MDQQHADVRLAFGAKKEFGAGTVLAYGHGSRAMQRSPAPMPGLGLKRRSGAPCRPHRRVPHVDILSSTAGGASKSSGACPNPARNSRRHGHTSCATACLGVPARHVRELCGGCYSLWNRDLLAALNFRHILARAPRPISAVPEVARVWLPTRQGWFPPPITCIAHSIPQSTNHHCNGTIWWHRCRPL